MIDFSWSHFREFFNSPKAQVKKYLTGRNLRRVKKKMDSKGKKRISALSKRLFSANNHSDGLTNHERVVHGRAKRMGLTDKEYMAKYPKTKGMK